MTYFWVHMVHFAMVASPGHGGAFRTFLLLNPQLANGGLFLHFYSQQRMLLDPDARVIVLLPDKRPLPSLIPSPMKLKNRYISYNWYPYRIFLQKNRIFSKP
jgi:hypothetical protein